MRASPSPSVRRFFLALAATLTCLGATASSAGAQPVFGYTDDWATNLGLLSQARASGAGSVRVFASWSGIEWTRGQYSWDGLDAVVANAQAAGMRPLLVALDAPTWARAGGCPGGSPTGGCTYAPAKAYDGDWARFVRTIAARYPTALGVEGWNEPNALHFFAPRVDASRYTELLKAAYPAIKAVQPNSTVIAAGLSRAWEPDSPPTFVSAMYAHGAKGFFDAMAMHPDVYPSGLAIDDDNGWSEVDRVHQLMVDNGDGAKKIWMTELGAPTSAPSAAGVSQQEQTRQITDVLWKAAESGFSGPAFIFSIRDVGTTDQGNEQDNFGALLTRDCQPKVAASVLAR